MRSIVKLALFYFAFFISSAHAGIYFQTFHNNTETDVTIDATLPGDWRDTPKYPIKVWSHHSLFDTERFLGVSNEVVSTVHVYKFQFQLMRNVGVPLGGSCSSEPNRLLVRVGKKVFRVYDCNWKVHVDKRSGNKWVETDSVDIPIGGPLNLLLQVYVRKDGELKVTTGKSPDFGDNYKCQRNHFCPRVPFYPTAK